MTARTSLIEASPGDQSPRDPRFVDGAPPASRQPEPPHTSRQVTAVVAVLSLAVFMASLDLFIVNLAFPYIARAYRGTSLSSLSWVLSGKLDPTPVTSRQVSLEDAVDALLETGWTKLIIDCGSGRDDPRGG